MHLPAPRTAVTAALLMTVVGCSSSSGDDLDALPTTPAAQVTPSSTITPSPAPIITVPSTATPTPKATRTPTRTVPPTTEAPDDPLTPRPPLETAPPTGQPLCDSDDLTVTDADAIIDKTSVQELFVVRTTGPDCELKGYPTVELRDAKGKVLRATYRPLPNERPTVHTLSKGTSISFVVASGRTGASCVDAAVAKVRLPGTSGALTTSTAFSVCDEAVGLSPIRRQLDIE